MAHQNKHLLRGACFFTLKVNKLNNKIIIDIIKNIINQMKEDESLNKNEIRIKYKEVRANIPLEEKKFLDKKIFNKVIEMKEYKQSKLILIYVSLKDEVDTINLIKHTLKIGKEVAVPKCIEEKIKFVKIKSFNDLKIGRFNILEPVQNSCVEKFNNSICIIPGIVFDKEQNRIGYGKGYYDRFLENYVGIKIGLSYRNCICDKIENEVTDIKMDIIITD